MRKIKKGDEVVILTGKSKGMHGNVLRTLEGGSKVVVAGANLVKKHIKSNPQANVVGSIVDREAPLHVSNVAIYNNNSKKADKVKFKVLNDGKKVRCFKSNNEEIVK